MKTRVLGIAAVIALVVCLALVGVPSGSRALGPSTPVIPASTSDDELEPIGRDVPVAVRIENEVPVAIDGELEADVPVPRLSGGVEVYGRVTDPEGKGIPNARVLVREFGANGWTTNSPFELGHGLTNADGDYRIPCPKLDAEHPMLVRSKKLFIHAEREGYTRMTRIWVTWSPINEPLQDIRRDFVLEPGRWVHGRILGPDGFPIAGAHVQILYQTPEGDGGGWYSWPPADANGEFSRPIAEGGELHSIWARSWQDGVARQDLRNRFAGSGDVDLGDVTLEPLGTLSGRAVLKGGQPASGLDLLAAPVEFRGSTTILAETTADFNVPPKRSVGLPMGRSSTDEEGRFRFAGLEHGNYVVYARLPGSSVERQRGTRVDTWFPTGSRDIPVVVDECRLVVELIDEQGQPLSNVKVRRDVLLGGPGQKCIAWTTSNGTLVFAVEPGSTYQLSAGVRRLGSAKADVEIPLDATEVHQQLVLVVDEPDE